MKKLFAAASLALAAFASHAAVITQYNAVADFPTLQNDLGTLSITGRVNGGQQEGINLTYTFDADTSYAGFRFTADQFQTLFVSVTATDKTVQAFSRNVSPGQMFWGFSVADSDLESVRFFTTSASGNNVNNDRIDITGVIGYAQPAPATGEVPEPATLALLGLGLLGFAASRRKLAKQ